MWRIAFYSLLLNAVWEFIQCTLLYDMGDMGFWRGTLWMWGAISGDVLIVLAVALLPYRLVSPRHLCPPDGIGWLVLLVIGFVAGVILEWAARALRLWTYGPLMPTLLLFGRTVGLSPIAQVTLLPALSVRLAMPRVHR